jgi:hypothetical protein
MKLTEELWKECGFLRGTTLTGEVEWYHPARKNLHELTYNPDAEYAPKTLHALVTELRLYFQHLGYTEGLKKANDI